MNTVQQKLKITLDIAKQLKFYETPAGKVNLWNEQYTFIPKLKQIFNDYIHGTRKYVGKLHFEEIDKWIEYSLPILITKKPLFVIRIK